MINSRGQVIGINTMVAGGLGSAVPSNRVQSFITLQSRPRLGVTLRPVWLRPALGEHIPGLIITEIQESTPAANAGLLVGDVLVAVDGNQITSTDILAQSLSGSTGIVELTLMRGEDRIRISIALMPAGGCRSNTMGRAA